MFESNMRGIISLLFAFTALNASATIYTVTDTTASSAFSLANAINQANANAGADTIEFNIPGIQLHTIVSDSLNDITDTVFINGLSQPGNIGTDFSNTTVYIRGDKGLSIHSAGCTLIGLRISNSNNPITAITVVADSGKSCSHTLIRRVCISGINGSAGILVYTDSLYGLYSHDLKIDSMHISVEGTAIEIHSSSLADLRDIAITNNDLGAGYTYLGAFYETPAINILREATLPRSPNIKITNNSISGHIYLQGTLDSIYIGYNSIYSSDFTISNCSINDSKIEYNDIVTGPGSQSGIGTPTIHDFLNDTISNIKIQFNRFESVTVHISFNGNNQLFDGIFFTGNELSAFQVFFEKTNVNHVDSQVIKNLIIKSNYSSNSVIVYPWSMVLHFAGKSVFSDVNIDSNTLDTYFSFIELQTDFRTRIKSISISGNYISSDQVSRMINIVNDGVTDSMLIIDNIINADSSTAYTFGLYLESEGTISNLKINNNTFSIDGLHDSWDVGSCGIRMSGNVQGEILGNTFESCTDAGIYIYDSNDSATVLNITLNTIFGVYHSGISINSVPYNPPSQNIGRYTIFGNSIYEIGKEGIYRRSQHDSASCITCIPKPELFLANYFNNTTTVYGSLSGDTLTEYIIEFFRNISPDTGGYTEGAYLIWRDSVTTDSTGNILFDIDIPGNFLPYFITATATSKTSWQTSEFSKETGVTTGMTDSKKESDIIVFPNPAEDELHIHSASTISQLKILDLLGNRTPFPVSNPHSNKVNLQNFSPGLYFLEITIEEKIIIKKILKH